MNRRHSTYTMFASATFVLVGLLAVYGYGLYAVFAQGAMVASLAEDVKALAETEAHLESMEDILEETEQERNALSVLFLNESSVVAFIEEVETVAEKSGVLFEIKSIDSVPIEGDEQYAWLTLSLSTEGSWGDSYQLFAQLERLPYVLLMDTVRFELLPDTERSTWSGLVVLSVAIINELP